MKYKSYSLHNYLSIPQAEHLSEETKRDISVVANVLPFKVNNYVLDYLINWDNLENDAMYHLTFPQKCMLSDEHYAEMAAALDKTDDKLYLKTVANNIRYQLNPHPAGQKEYNVPEIDGEKLWGVQHKYREIVLFFPSAGQTCHSYCTFCFRWPQFVGMDELKFAMKETELLVKYLEEHQEVTDILFTGGDPMIMSFKVFEKYIEPFISDDNKTNIQTIRIGSKALGFWPYKFVSDPDADQFLHLFERIVKKGINLSFMAHFSHPIELSTDVVKTAISRLRSTGMQIRSQSPILQHINDSAEIWSEKWREQVNQNVIPYYMFIPRDTGARDYFAVPLVKAWEIFREAYTSVSGICRSVRGPSMSCTPGKIQILGVSEINQEKVMALRFLQGREPDWVGRPFYAKYDPKALWIDDLKPAFSESFFFENEMAEMF
jgi:KamA family protein